MSENTKQEPTLVVGGTGKVGRRVVERLRARDLPVRIGSRSGDPRFDWEDRSTWARFWKGSARPTSPITGTRFREPPTRWVCSPNGPLTVAFRVSFCCGARGGRGRACGAGRARLRRRANGLALDLVRPELQRGLLAGTGPGQRGFASGRSTPEPFVDADDIADVAVAALTDDRHMGELYELPGPGSSRSRRPSGRSPARRAARSATYRSRSRSRRRCCRSGRSE